MKSLPIHDWQFWVVTLICLLSLAWLLRGVLPVPFFSKRASKKKHQHRVSLTIDGKPTRRSK